MHSFIKQIAKIAHEIICFVVYFSGLYVLISFLKRRKPVVLMYHSVNDQDCPYVYPDNIVSVENFEKQIAYLSRKKKVVSLSELVKHLESGADLPHNVVVITFDDGYYDFYSNAYPVLKRYGVLCTLFLVTGFLSTGDAKWDDKLAYIINSAQSGSVTVRLDGEEKAFCLASQKRRRDCIVELVRTLQNLDSENRSKILLEVERQLNSCALESKRVMLDWSEVVELASDELVSFGCHSHSHVNLGKVNPAIVEWEISKSKNEIEDKLGKPCVPFCYPFGKKGSFNQNVKKLLKLHGFLAAVTTIPGSVSKGSDLFELRRVAAMDDSSYRFKCSLIGLTLQRS
jgi:peptidoglycan/xylan/chitin deacetylase (PgdA/CDA1 family)